MRLTIYGNTTVDRSMPTESATLRTDSIASLDFSTSATSGAYKLLIGTNIAFATTARMIKLKIAFSAAMYLHPPFSSSR